MSEKLVLIDGHSILNRAFFGIPDLTNSEGLHTNAVYGFLNIMFKILEEEKPDYLTVAFDVSQPTFRHEMFAEYKGTRKPMAAELREQVPLMKEMLRAMGVTTIEKGGYEADDLLGTIAKRSEAQGLEVSVVSGDRDLLQLASEHIKIRIPKTKRTGTEIEDYYAQDVIGKYQVTPEQFIDVKALMGDTADNIPGVPGIGEKTATALIVAYGSIENTYAHVDEVKPPRAATNLREHYDMAQMSKTLATIDTDAQIEYSLSDAKLSEVSDLYTEEAYLLCKRLEFKNLLGRFSVDAPQSLAHGHFRKITDRAVAESFLSSIKGKTCGFYFVLPEEQGDVCTEADGQISLFGSAQEEAAESGAGSRFLGLAVAAGETDVCYMEAGAALPCGELRELFTQSGAKAYATLNLKPQLAAMGMLEKNETGTVRRDNLFDAEIAAYLLNPLKNEYPYEDIAKDYTGGMIPSRRDLIEKLTYEKAAEQKPEEFLGAVCYPAYVAWAARERLLSELQETGMEQLFTEIEMPLVFTLADMEKEGIRASGEALHEYGERLAVRIGELEQKIYAEAGEEFNINSPKQLGVLLFEKLQLPNGKKTKTGYSTAADVLERLAPEHPVVADIVEYRQLAKLKSTYADGLVNYIAQDGRIHTSFNQTITATGRLSREIEMPLVFTLADMEKEGIRASGEALHEYGERLAVRIGELEQKIYAEAGEEFNINSPKQLGVILFEKLQLPNGKKTKTGYSTAADVLERLAPEHPVVADILEYRQLAKLKSTYADGLVNYIAQDGRIHTSFNQTITATGRLSSTEPNLQNIPMRIELGRLIRKAFLPKEGFVFVDADYSQIELRVLAHLSGDEKLIEAYREAQDIHRTTASQVFHIPFDEVTDLQRRNAKAVNFGIVYGISSFGLSQDLSISKKEAAEYIERYFETYPKIKGYLDGLVAQAKEQGYVTTMFGRRRPVPELSSSNFMQRSFGERIAMNSPIQGTAADIIKIAMIRVHDRLLDEQLASRLILTVHDELLVETAVNEEEKVRQILAEEMHGAAKLAVCLEIDVHTGSDWYQAK